MSEADETGRSPQTGRSTADAVEAPTGGGPVAAAVRVFISYAHDDAEHEARVRRLWLLLRENGIDARLDAPADDRPQDWSQWMQDQVRAAAFTLVIASPAYRRRAEGTEPPDLGRGARWEAQLIKQEWYADRDRARGRFLPVVLPGCTPEGIPVWMDRETGTHYRVADYTVAGAEKLLRYLTAQAATVIPPLGVVPHLPPRPLETPPGPPVASPAGSSVEGAGGAGRVRLRTAVDLHASLDPDGMLTTRTVVAGTPVGHQQRRLPNQVTTAWQALTLGPGPARDRLAEAGRLLAATLLTPATRDLLGRLVDQLPPGDGVDIVLHATAGAGSLPLELLRLPTSAGADGGPVCLRPGVTLARHVTDTPRRGEPVSLPGPVKILAAVAAPDETQTASSPLDVEAEMQAVLEATTGLAAPGTPNAAGQLRILEVASLDQITEAIQADEYQVLHLSAHGSFTEVELETEDGAPDLVDAGELIDALRRADRPVVPLIVLSACSAGTTPAGSPAGVEAVAAGLLARGADR